MIEYFNGKKKEYATLIDDDLKVVKWYLETSFAVLPDFQGHTRANMDMGPVTIQTVYRKQKLNTIISTEAELVDVDDGSVYIL